MVANDSIDWETFVAQCSNHLILPVIYLKFRAHGFSGYLPEDLAEYLKDIYELNRERNTQVLKQIEEVTLILNKTASFQYF